MTSIRSTFGKLWSRKRSRPLSGANNRPMPPQLKRTLGVAIIFAMRTGIRLARAAEELTKLAPALSATIKDKHVKNVTPLNIRGETIAVGWRQIIRSLRMANLTMVLTVTKRLKASPAASLRHTP